MKALEKILTSLEQYNHIEYLQKNVHIVFDQVDVRIVKIVSYNNYYPNYHTYKNQHQTNNFNHLPFYNKLTDTVNNQTQTNTAYVKTKQSNIIHLYPEKYLELIVKIKRSDSIYLQYAHSDLLNKLNTLMQKFDKNFEKFQKIKFIID